MDPEFDELKREFLAEASSKMRDIQAALADPNKQSFERVTYLAHQLKGAGGSYGFQRISTEAAELEKAVEKVVHSGSTTLSDQIHRHADALSKEIDERSRELTPASS
jgi:HPt (histidine-containing phosphotransfer) domain-containing protein